jgi:hypothetical protein
MDYKFKGLSKGRNEWLYGDLIHLGTSGESIGITFISEGPHKVRVTTPIRPETLGMYIGMKDWRGKDIYSKDIIMLLDNGDKYFYLVDYMIDEDYPAFDMVGNDLECNLLSHLRCIGENPYYVVGNLYDTPVLIDKLEGNHGTSR